MTTEGNVRIFSEGRGQLPWELSETSPRVILGANYAICGILDMADLAERVVACVNGGTPRPFPREGKGVLPWRSGTSVLRTLYDANDTLIGVMDTPAIAAQVVAAVNERGTTR